MHKGIKKILLVLVIVAAGKLHALDLTFTGGVGNFSFDNKSLTAIGAGEFTGKFYPLIHLNVKDQITDIFGYSATIERDPVLRNTLSCEMTIDGNFIKLSVGPLFSMFNSWDTIIRPGVTTSLGLEFSGIFFINLRGGATFGSSLENNYAMETSRIALGFWVPNVINTISLTIKKFNEINVAIAQDELLRICYRADVHAKNVPYTISIDMGYQTLKRTYTFMDEDLMRQIFIGLEINIDFTPNFTFILGAEIPVYIWGEYPLRRADKYWAFEAFTGLTWHFQKRNK